MDSSAISHVTNNGEVFSKLDTSICPEILTERGERIRIGGIGHYTIECVDGQNDKVSIISTDVLYAPALKENLIAVSKLDCHRQPAPFKVVKLLHFQIKFNHLAFITSRLCQSSNTIRASTSKQSPDADGIPREFYLRMFDIIHRELNILLNEELNSNLSLPIAFMQGIIVLVKKRGTNNATQGGIYRVAQTAEFCECW